MNSLRNVKAEPNGSRIPVYYEGSDTIYEGMALCYNSDTTTNKSRYNSATTAEGSQNEGKYWFVEKPKSDNLLSFAGVVASGNWCGKTGPCVVEIYEPKGDIVPVRASINCVEGETVLCVQAGDYEFQTNTYTNNSESVPVALALEDVDRSSTEGLCLAQLYHPLVFSPNCVGVSTNEPLVVGAGVTTGDCEGLGRALVNYVGTGGVFTFQRRRAELNAAGGGLGGISGTHRFEAVIGGSCSSQEGSYQVGLGSHMILKSGATLSAAYFHAGIFKIENQDATPATITSAVWIAPLRCELQLDTNDAANKISQMYFCSQGDVHPDALFRAESLNAIGAYASTGDAPALATGDIMIPVNIAGTVYYIPALQDTGV